MPEIGAQVGGDVDQLAAIALKAIFLCALLVGALHILIILVAFYQLPWLLGLAAARGYQLS